MKAYLSSFTSNHFSHVLQPVTRSSCDKPCSLPLYYFATSLLSFRDDSPLLGMTLPDRHSSFMLRLSIVFRCLLQLLPLFSSNVIRKPWPLCPRHSAFTSNPASLLLLYLHELCQPPSCTNSVAALLISVSPVPIVFGTRGYSLKFAV